MRAFSIALLFFTSILMQDSANADFSLSNDFSFTDNPNGAWTYGWSSSLAGLFQVDVDKRTFDGGLQQWMGNPDGNSPAFGHPSVFYNPNAVPTGNGYAVAPGAVAMHPGLSGEFSVVRWVAPTTGAYAVQLAASSGVEVPRGLSHHGNSSLSILRICFLAF